MTAMMQERHAAGSDETGWASRLLVPEMWATVSIVAMWLAVLFVGVFGGDMTFHDPSYGVTVIPSAVAVAMFAGLGTFAVAKRGFGRNQAK